MTGKASADDFQVQDFLRKKKKKKQEEYNEIHGNDDRESRQNAERSCSSPLLFEDQAAQSEKDSKKKKNNKKKGKKQESSLGDSCVGLGDDIGDGSGVDDSQKKRKKKKKKEESSLHNSCVGLVDDIGDGSGVDDSQKKRKKQESSLGNSCVGLVDDIGDGSGMDDSQKKKKKKKKESSLGDSCVELEDNIGDGSGVDDSQKKKKKKKKEEESSLHNSCVGLVDDIGDGSGVNDSQKKKKKKKESSLGDSCVELEDKISNGSGVDDSQKKRKKQESSLGNSCVGLGDEIGDGIGVDDSQKKKKKKKKEESSLGNSCVGLEDNIGDGSGVDDSQKKKKKKKKKEEESSLGDSCVGVGDDIGDGSGVDDSQKKKKRKKRKYDCADEQSDGSCVPVNQHNTGGCQEIHAEDVYLKESKKRKRKELPEEAEVCELSASETQGKSSSRRFKKKRKKKRKRDSGTQESQEETDVSCECCSVEQSPLSSQEPNRQGESTEEGGGTAPQQQHGDADCDADCDAASVMSEDSAVSKAAKAADGPPKTPGRARKEIKSCPFVEESSSDSEVMPPELSALDKKDQESSFTEVADSDDPSLDDEEPLDVTSVVDLDTAKRELEEFIPHVRSISEGSIRKMAGRDLARFKEFKKQGIAVRFGRFSQKENNQVRKNVEEFLQLTGIDSAEKLLFISRYPEEKETISRLKAEHLFCEKLSEHIPRPWRLIYYRARKMFDPNNYKGRYTDEEKEQLKKYHAMYGNDWKKISEMMCRSNLSVAMKYSEIKSAVNYGPWSKEETQKLKHAVEEVIRKRMGTENGNCLSSSAKSNQDLSTDLEKLYQKLPWTEIEAKVGTRYWRQCKQKWISILTNKMTKGHQLYRGTKGLEAKINLIKRLHEMNVEDANDINWEELSKVIGDVPRAYVQARFYKLKVSSVPLWQEKTFSEIIDYLFEKKLPELEEKLQKSNGEGSCDNSTSRQEKAALSLSDIFDSSEDSD